MHAMSRTQILMSLNARHFVEVRTIPGGPAPQALEPEILRAREQLAKDTLSLATRRESLQQAHKDLHRQCQALAQAR